jgi:hypothetical protein
MLARDRCDKDPARTELVVMRLVQDDPRSATVVLLLSEPVRLCLCVGLKLLVVRHRGDLTLASACWGRLHRSGAVLVPIDDRDLAESGSRLP